jgi:NTE family protein
MKATCAERRHARTWAIVLMSALLSAGCASALAVTAPAAGTATPCVGPGPDREVLLGVALSGGGSRAALFGASGLEALGRMRAPGGGSVLEQVSYLSSVSGGSVARSACSPPTVP